MKIRICKEMRMMQFCIILILIFMEKSVVFASDNTMDVSSGAMKLDAEDGTYMVDVKLEGGSGRATITSPAQLKIQDKKATIQIEWSSTNYDYMVCDGVTYYPIRTEGNSTFELPVMVLDQPFEVTADTTAMSVPHEIDYRIMIDSSAIDKHTSAVGSVAEIIMLAIVLLGIFIGIRFYLHKKKEKKV